MITSIFSKSKPINFIIVFVITLLAFLVAKSRYLLEPVTATLVLQQAVAFIVCYISILLVNFIADKNKLTQNNNYEVLLFSLFLLIMPEALNSGMMLMANFFILLALRRILSLRTQKQIDMKLFDAAFWVAIATLFYFWSILFFVFIIVILLLYTDNNVKHWIIPFVGLATVFVIAVGVSIVLYDEYFAFFTDIPSVSFDFSVYNSVPFLVAITLFFSFGVWASFYYLKGFNNMVKTLRPSYRAVFTALLIGFAIIVMAPEKNGTEFIFFFAPLAIIIANYLEAVKENWFKEVFLAILVITPVVLLML